MLCMYVGVAVTMMDIPGGGIKMVRVLSISGGDGSESLIIHSQCIDGARVSYFILYGNSINFVSK